MAKFVYVASEDGNSVRLQADDGEEIPIEMVAAWALLRQASAQKEIAENVIGLDNAINRVADVLTDVAAR